MASFADIRRAAPPIHVFNPVGKFGEGGVAMIEPHDKDGQHDHYRYSDGGKISDYVQGDGSEKSPYQYQNVGPVSAHYAVVDLWSRFRNDAVFIQVNNWLLKVSPNGVTASDGHFTKLA